MQPATGVDETTAKAFTQRVTRAVLVIAVTAALVYFLVARGAVLMLLFAGILFGVVLQSLSEMLQRKTRLDYRSALAVVTAAVVLASAAMLWLLSWRVASQLGQLLQQLPDAYSQLLREVQSSPIYQHFFAAGGGEVPSLKPSPQALLRGTTGVAQRLVDLLAAVALVFFIGLFAAAEPEVYARAATRLVAPRRRAEVRALLAELNISLFRWLVGRAVAMAAVGIITAVGLLLFHIPMALALSVIATVLTFIPYLGAVLSAIPAVLLALPLGGSAVLAVVGIYVVAHVVEGYLVAPIVTRKAVEFPPAFTLATQVLLGAVWGLAGLTLANPVTVVAVLLVQRLYVDRLEGRPPGGAPLVTERDSSRGPGAEPGAGFVPPTAPVREQAPPD